MKKESEERTDLDLEAVLGDDKLTRLRRAYHELEAFQLSPAHSEAKWKLKESLARPALDHPDK
jgi:hypothetical protein